MKDFSTLAPLDGATLDGAIAKALEINRGSLKDYTDKFKYSHSVDGVYPQSENVEWTTGFWTGELWLSWEFSHDEAFREAALRQTDSFADRIARRIDVEHHDMGFLYSPSCVAAYKLTGSEVGRKAALEAADNLVSRFQEKGQFIQAWGRLGDVKEYRLIIDCLLNLPLLFWASRETGDSRYEDVARRHLDTAISLVLRRDDSTFHTYFFDPETGRPTHGVTAQGNRDGSAWSRGQAWGVYGTALAWRYTHEERTREVFSRCLDFFLDHLPGDIIPYWDFDFSNPSTEPRDSSALAIVICGMLEASRSMPGMEGLEDVARRLMKVLVDKCAVMPGGSCNGLLAHATYARKSQWNTCRNRGVDECNIWGDYYYLEALRRLKGEWDPYW